MTHPITPPPDKIHNWLQLEKTGYNIEQIIALAAQWGADQELEACCEWLQHDYPNIGANALRAARRPKPPSLKEEGFTALELLKQRTTDPNIIEPLSRALEALLDDQH